MKSHPISTISLFLLSHPIQGGADTSLHWASTGGGWRAMVADMAYANVFAQAGLLETSSSKFQAISAESGGAWFALQLFHSEPFYKNVTESSPQGLYDFVISWMNSYGNWSNSLPMEYKLCRFLDRFNDTQALAQFCTVYLDEGGNWANFVMGMLGEVSKDYGDAKFVNKTVEPSTRINALLGTEEFIQTSLSPTARLRESDTGIFIGPASTLSRLGSKKEVYAVPLGVQYSVTNDGTLYFSSTDANAALDNLKVYTKHIPNHFSFNHWKEYQFFNGNETSGSVLIHKPSGSSFSGKLNAPFGGGHATVAQLAGASSAALGKYSGLTPSMLAQYMSKSLYEGTSKSDVLAEANAFYQRELFDQLTVCSQWPDNECGANDGRFIDGVYGDSPTVALNVAQFQARHEYDEDTTLKFFVSLNPDTPLTPTVLAYFFSPCNHNGTEAPGDFIWPDYDGFFSLPMRSPQLFDQYLDMDMLEAMSMPLNGTNVTTATISATTIDNPAFHVKAGLNVELFILRLNEGVGDIIIGEVLINDAKNPLAEMAKGIAGSDELVQRVKNFVRED